MPSRRWKGPFAPRGPARAVTGAILAVATVVTLDAARVDGCSEWRGYLTIILPLCKPILATLGIFVFLWHWNDFLWPLIVSQDISMRTLTVGIASLQQQGTSLNVLFAGTLISFIPIFAAYLIGQRYLTEGVLSSGIKG